MINNFIVFPHVERTGGSTIHYWFYFLNQTGNHYIDTGGVKLKDLVVQHTESQTAYLGGHFKLTDFEKSQFYKLSNSPYIFGIVRPTVERFVSMYRLWLRSPEWLGAVTKEDASSLMKFYLKIQKAHFSNNLCKAYSSRGDYDAVMEGIGRNLRFIGYTNRLDLVIERFRIDQPLIYPLIKSLENTKVNQGAFVSEDQIIALGLDKNLIDLINADNAEDNLLIKHISENNYIIG